MTAFQSVIGAAAAWTAALRDWDGGQLQQAATSRNSGEAGAPAVRIPETEISRPCRLTGSPGALPCNRELPSGSRASNRSSTAATTYG